MKLRGRVIEGDGYGKKLGFPTANIDRDEYQEKNPDLVYGIYAGLVTIAGEEKQYKAGLVVGPDDAWGLPKLEAHILDFDRDLYGEEITFHFVEFLREFEAYDDEASLKKAIADDIKKIQSKDVCLLES